MLSSSKVLADTFAVGVGNDPIHDNMGGAILKELRQAMTDCTMAVCLEDMNRITPSTIKAICTAVEWFEDVFDEINQGK